MDTSSITYTAEDPSAIVFRALYQPEATNGHKLFELLEKDHKLSAYLHIIRDSPRWPVIRDGRGEVLSLPPIINSEYSKIDLNTKDVFIDCTATDLNKACAALNCLINSLRMQTTTQSEVETVQVVYDTLTDHHCQLEPVAGAPNTYTYPDVSSSQLNLRLSKLSSISGIPCSDLSVEKIQSLFTRVCISSEVAKTKTGGDSTKLADLELVCHVPFYRQDILGEADLIENFCIAYGYNNIAANYAALPHIMTLGSTLPNFRIGEMVRAEAVACGYTEMVLFSLCPQEDAIFSDLPVELSNTKTLTFTHARSSIAPGLLRTASAHQHASLPLKFFEVADVLEPNGDPNDDVGISTKKRFACIYGGGTDGFEFVHGLLDHLMRKLQKDFRLVREDHETCLPGRRASIRVNEQSIGWIGVIHPDVLLKYKVPIPCTVLEFRI